MPEPEVCWALAEADPLALEGMEDRGGGGGGGAGAAEAVRGDVLFALEDACCC